MTKMNFLKDLLTMMLLCGLLLTAVSCGDDDSCPEGTEEAYDLDGNVIGCIEG